MDSTTSKQGVRKIEGHRVVITMAGMSETRRTWATPSVRIIATRHSAGKNSYDKELTLGTPDGGDALFGMS